MVSNIYFLLCLLATEVNEITSIAFRPKSSASVEPLLRFPFIRSLANPCGFQLESAAAPSLLVATSDQHRSTLAPLRDVRDDIPLDQQVLDFLSPFRELITSANERSLNDSTKIKEQSRQELQLVVSQALLLIRHIYSPSALRKCNGFQMETLSRDNLLIVFSRKGGIQLEELYRILMILSAHLHVMIRDVHRSTRFCPTQNFIKVQRLMQLTGTLETSMCLIMHSAILTEEYDNWNYLTVTRKVLLQTRVHRYYDCSAREIQGCLVLRKACEIFKLMKRHIQRTRKASFTS